MMFQSIDLLNQTKWEWHVHNAIFQAVGLYQAFMCVRAYVCVCVCVYVCNENLNHMGMKAVHRHL